MGWSLTGTRRRVKSFPDLKFAVYVVKECPMDGVSCFDTYYPDLSCECRLAADLRGTLASNPHRIAGTFFPTTPCVPLYRAGGRLAAADDGMLRAWAMPTWPSWRWSVVCAALLLRRGVSGSRKGARRR
jgi:hypothetical protein